MLGFKSFNSARAILGGIEMVHMMRKQQAKYVAGHFGVRFQIFEKSWAF